MPLVPMRCILDHAAERGYGMPAFNITNLETLQGVLRAADATDSPVILQATRSARGYVGDIFLRHMLQASVATYPHLPIAMHLDHGSSPSDCEGAFAVGFSSVMMDGSLMEDGKTPSSYAYNVDVTARVVRNAHTRGISVEGEIGVLGSLETGSGDQEDGHGFEGTLGRDKLVTDPDEAASFVRDTGVDALAVAIGTSHGAYKFSRKPSGEILAMDALAEIHARLPNTHLVMHGASTVPMELQEKLNKFGGDIPQTYGVPMEEVEKGIRHGVRKVNIDTDIRMAMTAAIRRQFAEKPASFDIRGYLKPAVESVASLCRERYERFGCAGNGSRVRPVGLEEMAKRYAAGLVPMAGASE
ncbi:class II fructose-bisphosphate aldolase [Pelagibacterium sediminicola]|uniref:class II fructose-bisphosphate aldolase n=1 Tax=Pelagibacterium sediminicola TaxID=2248761 RepID=UPI000E313F9C|nr:class II fructose-bisphosphate aldolase [Pelagibacterium sediminicola]